MGILGYFRNRRARESALGSAEEQAAIEEAVAQAKAESARLQEEHEQAGNGGTVGGLAGLGVLFSQLQAAQAAGVNVEAAGLTADLRGSDLREEILGVIAAHGLDATQDGQAIDASSAGALRATSSPCSPAPASTSTPPRPDALAIVHPDEPAEPAEELDPSVPQIRNPLRP